MCASRIRTSLNDAAWLVLALPAFMIALPADAQRREPAPITYRAGAPAGQGQQQAPVRVAEDRASQRIQFRYPDHPISVDDPQPGAPGPAPRAQPSSMPTTNAGTQQPPGQGAGSVQTAAHGPMPSSVDTIARSELGPRTPAASAEFHQTGLGIVYGDEFAGLPTANGELFSQTDMTAAHPSLPLPSLVRVTNRQNGKEVVVRVNDRGPFEDGAALQVSRRVADTLEFGRDGRAMLDISYLGPAPAAPIASAPAAPSRVAAPAVPPPPSQAELLGGDDEFVRPGPAPRQLAHAVVSPASGQHFVQLASFTELGNAEALYRSLAAGWPVEIVPARVHGADFFRVRIGPFSDRDTAELHRDRLFREGRAEGRVVTSQYY